MKKTSRSLLKISTLLIVSICAISLSGCTVTPNYEAEGTTTTILNPSKDISKYSANEQLYIIAGKMQTIDSYKSIITGSTVSEFPKYTQNIKDIHIKSGSESYLESISTSLLVNVGKQAFFNNGKVVLRDATDVIENTWNDNYVVTTTDDYLRHMGTTPIDLSNYILNENTIVSATSTKLSDGTYKIDAIVDPIKGTSRYSVKMMNYGGLKNLPKFNSCSFSLTFDENYYPIKLESNDTYTVQKGILTLSCTSSLTEVFSEFNIPQEIPNRDTFKEYIKDDSESLDETVKDVEGNELLFNTILGLDLNNGIKLNGNLNVEVNGKKESLPIDAWMAFDFDDYVENGVNNSFRGYASTVILGEEVSIFYVGDDYLYVNIGNTKYKYYLPKKNTPSVSVDDIVKVFIITEGERISNNRFFTLTLNDEIKNQINNVLGMLKEKLPSELSFLNVIKLNDLSVNVLLTKKTQSEAYISTISLVTDVNIFKANFEVLISERPYDMPTEDELTTYENVNLDAVKNTFIELKNVIKEASKNNFTQGINLNLQVGLESSEDPSKNFILPLTMEVQNSPTNGPRVHVTFALAGMFGGPSEFYYENGKIYIVKTAKDGDKVYAANVDVVELKDSINGIINGFLSGKVSLNDVSLYLSELILKTTVKRTIAPNNDEIVEFSLSEKLTKAISIGYRSLIAKAKTADLGAMGPLLGALLVNFDFDIDNVLFECIYNNGNLISLKLKLKNNNTSILGGGKDLSFIIKLDNATLAPVGQTDKNYSIIAPGIKAMEESAEVRKVIKDILDDGITHLGASFQEKLNKAFDLYNALSKDGQMSVLDYKAFTKLNSDYNKALTNAVKFVENMELVIDMLQDETKQTEVINIFNKTLNPTYKRMDVKQKEYAGTYLINLYLKTRSEIEKNYTVKEVMDEIDKLTIENYPTYKEFNRAIFNAQRKYNDLLDESKALVTNFSKIAEARKVCDSIKNIK